MHATPPARLLIVDDEEPQMNALRDTLSELGYLTTGFTSASEALRALEHQEFDMLLTDLMMPEMDGILFLRSALEIDKFLVGIVMTGYGTVETAVEAMKIGAVDYVLKPFKLSAVLPIIARGLTLRRLRLENIQLLETVAIYELSMDIAFGMDSATVVRKIADAAMREGEASDFSILLLAADGKELRVAVARGQNAASIEMTRWPMTGHISSWIARTYRLISSREEPADIQSLLASPFSEMTNGISLPMVANGALVGILNFTPARPRRAIPLGRIKTLKVMAGTGASALRATSLAIQMSYSAEHDFLTDLPNRLLMQDRITQAIAMAHRHRIQLSVLFLDLDGFKHINDSLGHTVGDKLLQSVAARLRACVRNSDTVSRQGGDEFVILLSEVKHAADAAIGATKILTALATPHMIDHHELYIGASIGLSTYPEDGSDAETLMKNADTAMYYAKEKGHNQYHFFKKEMNAVAIKRQSLEGSLRRAIERDEFLLHFQPKINLKTGAITGGEALIRWLHPGHGLVSPMEFIPIAEECGLILPIGEWVLREACRQTRAWQDAGLRPIPVAVNVSGVEFRNKDFLEGIRRALNDTRLDPHFLELELTESVLMRHAESSTTMLKALKGMGVRLAVDDFGTGYSSLSYLRQFPIDSLKVDQSFVQEITTDKDDRTIVSAVISMAKSLGQLVIAEGVETADQLTFLQGRGCDEGQGYFFGRPVEANQFAKLLETGRSEIILIDAAP